MVEHEFETVIIADDGQPSKRQTALVIVILFLILLPGFIGSFIKLDERYHLLQPETLAEIERDISQCGHQARISDQLIIWNFSQGECQSLEDNRR